MFRKSAFQPPKAKSGSTLTSNSGEVKDSSNVRSSVRDESGSGMKLANPGGMYFLVFEKTRTKVVYKNVSQGCN